MKPRLASLVVLLACCGSAVADHDTGASLSWHVLSGGLDESRIAIYRQRELVGIFDFACDLTAAADGNPQENGASLNLVQPESNPEGLLIVTCNVGAHSQHIAVIDPTSKSNQPVLARTGSYFADWEIQDGELWISYDQACDTGPTIDCPDGFATVFVQYPGR